MRRASIITVLGYLIEVNCCIFYSNYVTASGGAIRVTDVESGLICTNCVFSNCTSTKTHGAILFEAKSSYAYISECYFENCDATDTNVAEIKSNNSSVRFITIANCGMKKMCTNHGFTMFNGNQTMTHSNISNTYASHFSGLIMKTPQNSMNLGFIHVSNHRLAEFNYGFYSMPAGIMTQYVNIINNSVVYSLVYLYSTNNIILSHYIFKSNTGSLSSTSSSWPGTCTYIDCMFLESSYPKGSYVSTIINPVYLTDPPTYQCHDFKNSSCSESIRECPTLLKQSNIILISYLSMYLVLW